VWLSEKKFPMGYRQTAILFVNIALATIALSQLEY